MAIDERTGWPTDPEAFAAKQRALEEMARDMEERQTVAEELQAKDPTLPDIAAIVIAGDVVSARRAQRMLDAGEPFRRCLMMVGSYARLDFALRAVEAGKWDRAELIAQLPDLWRGSDPDDTDHRFLALWREAYLKNGGAVCDGPPLPEGRIKLYRGQRQSPLLGIAWSLDVEIARKFAVTLGLRTAMAGGVVIVRYADSKDAYGYLTGRGESEVVIDPRLLRRA